jgi:hypothetical protein
MVELKPRDFRRKRSNRATINRPLKLTLPYFIDGYSKRYGYGYGYGTGKAGPLSRPALPARPQFHDGAVAGHRPRDR